MKYIILVFVAILFTGCATQMSPRPASEYLLTTDRGVSDLFQDIRVKLEANKYAVKKEDQTAGLLVTSPRSFSFDSGGKKIHARQIVQMRQEGGSLKLRIMYECNYLRDKKSYTGCHQQDSQASAKIARIEPALLALLKPVLMRNGNNNKTENIEIKDSTEKPAAVPQPTSAPAEKAKPKKAQSKTDDFSEDWGDEAK